MNDRELRALFADYWMAKQAASEALKMAKDCEGSPLFLEKARKAEYWLKRMGAMTRALDLVFRVGSRRIDLSLEDLGCSPAHLRDYPKNIVPFPTRH